VFFIIKYKGYPIYFIMVFIMMRYNRKEDLWSLTGGYQVWRGCVERSHRDGAQKSPSSKSKGLYH
jgi:hypothetical protein